MDIIPLLIVTTKVLIIDLHQPIQGIPYEPDTILVSYGAQYAPATEHGTCAVPIATMYHVSLWGAYCNVPGLAKGTGMSFGTQTSNIGYNPLRSALT